MITKPAVLECTRCGKIFIGYDRDVRPKGWPTCLKCSARDAWNALAAAVGEKSRAARARKPGRAAGRKAPKRAAAAGRGAARKRR